MSAPGNQSQLVSKECMVTEDASPYLASHEIEALRANG